jgi:hypothetical protein
MCSRAAHPSDRVCGFSALEERAAVDMVAALIDGEPLNEETSARTCRDAYSPEHRRLHHRTPATDGDEGLRAGSLNWGKGRHYAGPFLFTVPSVR